jgi:hypothetical protein
VIHVFLIKIVSYFTIIINIKINNYYHELFGGLNRYKSALNFPAVTIIKITLNLSENRYHLPHFFFLFIRYHSFVYIKNIKMCCMRQIKLF